ASGRQLPKPSGWGGHVLTGLALEGDIVLKLFVGGFLAARTLLPILRARFEQHEPAFAAYGYGFQLEAEPLLRLENRAAVQIAASFVTLPIGVGAGYGNHVIALACHVYSCSLMRKCQPPSLRYG